MLEGVSELEDGGGERGAEDDSLLGERTGRRESDGREGGSCLESHRCEDGADASGSAACHIGKEALQVVVEPTTEAHCAQGEGEGERVRMRG